MGSVCCHVRRKEVPRKVNTTFVLLFQNQIVNKIKNVPLIIYLVFLEYERGKTVPKDKNSKHAYTNKCRGQKKCVPARPKYAEFR